MPADPKRIQDLFLRLVKLPHPDRPAALDRECGSDADLRQRVAVLLEAHSEPDSYLDRPSDNFAAPLDSQPGAAEFAASGEQTLGSGGARASDASQTATTDYRRDAVAGVVIGGRYTLQEKVGEGGMGEVWVARQTEPVQRKVALKLIKMGMDSRAVLQRFEQERQALALMDHPHIARVLDGGMTPSGQPFFVMELVHGLPLIKFCNETRLTSKARLELFVPICQAVQHAHHKGIVHRDLKPANILITMIDGKPVPKVIDFGVAKATFGKLTDETMSTGFGAVVGTLEYMSPEQAGLAGEDIDTRADIYSLGVILYELLTGLRPIDAVRLRKSALTEMLRIIQEEEPSKPSTRLSTDASMASQAALQQTEPTKLMALLRGELDWVVMKCLEKQRDRRYDTANGLARDVQRYLADEVVEARPPSVGYRLQKFVRRHKGQAIAASLVVFALLAGLAGTTWGLFEARKQKAEAERQAQIARDETGEKEKARAAADADRDRADRAAIESRRSATRADVVNTFLIRDLLAQADPRNNPVGDRVTVREILDRAVQAVAKDPAIAANPEVEAPIRYLLGNVYFQLGRSAEAEPQLRRALALNGDLFGLDNDRTLDTVNDLSGALRGLRKLDESRELLNRTLAQTRRVPDDPRILRLQNNMGLVFKDRGELVEAELVFRRCWDRARAIPGFDASERLKYLANFTWILVARGDRMKAAEAYQLIHDRLDEFPQAWGAESRDAYAVLDTLGSAARIVGRGNEAAKWLGQAWQGRKLVLGENHEETLASMNNLALVLLADGKPIDAESLFRRAAEAAWPAGEGGMRSRATAQFNLGLTLKAQEKWSEAADPMREALKVYRRQSGLADAQTSMIAATLLDVLAARDLTADFEEAEKLLVELLPPTRKTFAPGSPQVIDVLNRIALTQLRLRKFEAVETPLREVLAIREKDQANVWTTFNTKSLLGGALLGQKKFADAEPLLLAGYEGMKQREAMIPDQGKVRLPEAVDRLIEFYTATDKPEEVQHWQAERAKYPPSAPAATETM